MHEGKIAAIDASHSDAWTISYFIGYVDIGGVGVHVHGLVGALCGVEREEGGYYEGFIHVTK